MYGAQNVFCLKGISHNGSVSVSRTEGRGSIPCMPTRMGRRSHNLQMIWPVTANSSDAKALAIRLIFPVITSTSHNGSVSP